jgi:hypothetical protein
MIRSPLSSPLRSALSSAFDVRRGGGAPAFTPLALFSSGEQGAWYDPSDFSTLFQDAAGTVPVTAAGQPVGRILDKSGRGNHATQSTATARPLLGLDGSGNYYLQFDGVDDALFTSAFSMGSGAVSVFAGIYRNTSGTATVCAFTPAGEGESNSFVLWSTRGLVSNDMGMAGKATTLVYSNAGAQAISTPQVQSAFWNTAAPSQSLRLNSTQIASSSSSMGAGNFGTKPLYIGSGALGSRHNGRIYSLILVSRLTTAGETADAETFVGSKTGVVL